MERKNIKIKNMGKSHMNLNFEGITSRVLPLPAGGIGNISEDELNHLMNTSKAIYLGKLKVTNPEVLSDYIEKDNLETPNGLTDEDIVALLGTTQKNVKKVLGELDSLDTVKRVMDKAIELDKSANMVAIIEEKIDELTKVN